MTQKQKAAISKRLLGNTYRRGKKMSASAKAAISKSLIGNKYRKGIPHPPEIKKKISEGLKRAMREGRRKKTCLKNRKRDKYGKLTKGK